MSYPVGIMGVMVLCSLSTAVDGLVELDPDVFADRDTIRGLHRELARLSAVVARADAAFEASGVWSADLARSAASWLGYRCHQPMVEVKGSLAEGRAMRVLPRLEQARLDGQVSSGHGRMLARLLKPATRQAAIDDEDHLVEMATKLDFVGFARALAYWEQHVDPDGCDDEAERQRIKRQVSLVESYGGMWLGAMTLDPVSGQIVESELSRLERALFEADWAQAKTRLGRKPLVSDLGRTGAQRRADALVEMATRSATAPADGRRPRPLFTALVGYETLHGRICQLASGRVISPAALLPWLDEALVERVVFDAKSRPIDVGRAERLFTGATRRAIEVRDRECTVEDCHVPYEECEIDHITPYECNGPTTTDNGRCHCPFHNRKRNKPPPPDD